MSGIGAITVLSDEALELRVPSQEAAQARAAQLRASGAWAEVVAGERSVAVLFDALAEDIAAATARLRAACAAPPPPLAASTADTLTIPVRYGGADGPDLAALAARAGIEEAEVIARHGARLHTVAMLGFTPGFAYLDPAGGGDASLRVPRLATPRPRVPAGAVGVAEGRTGLYALPGPGGWPLIGRTDAALFDARADPPARLAPGQRVRFVPA